MNTICKIFGHKFVTKLIDLKYSCYEKGERMKYRHWFKTKIPFCKRCGIELSNLSKGI